VLASVSLGGGVLVLKTDDANSLNTPGAFGSFRVMHQIGVGVLGPVFRTYNPSQDRLFAVKAFHVDITPEQVETLVESLTRLVNSEVSHPGVVVPVAVGVEEGVPFIAQEYVAAESLDVAVRHYTAAEIGTTLPIVRQLSQAIDAAHGCGLVHGGLHLRDVFVAGDEVRVTGFGIVAALEEVGLRAPIRRPYAAPEMTAGRFWGPEADRFALAALAYELLTGKRAVGTGSQVTERLDAVDGVVDVDELQTVFATALADAPDGRYASAARFASDLRAAAGQDIEEESELRQSSFDPDTFVLDVGKTTIATSEKVDRLDEVDLHPDLVAEDSPDEQDDSAEEAAFFLEPDFTNDIQSLDSEAVDSIVEDSVEVEAVDRREKDEFMPNRRPPSSFPSVRNDSSTQNLFDRLDDTDLRVPEGAVLESGRRLAWGSSSVLVTIGMLTIGITAGYFSYSGLKTVDDRGDSPHDEVLNLPEASVLLNQSSTEVVVEEAELVDERAEVFIERSTADIVQGAQSSVQPSLPALPGAVSRGDRTMMPGLGWVLVRTTPPGASVTLDGVDRGLTPLALRDIPYGRYHVEVGHVGYRTHSENVTLSIDLKVAAIGIGLRSIEEGVPATQAVCSIAVESRPPGARVVIDRNVVGITPAVVSDLVAGRYQVRLERDGYQSWVTTVDVSESNQLRITASLEHLPKQ
jgi:serine/threonine protein kinase